MIGLKLDLFGGAKNALRGIRAKTEKLYGKEISGVISAMKHESGHCYTAPLPLNITLSDKTGKSEIKIFEDKSLLGPPHCLHDDIRGSGLGRYSHWDNYLYFSTSDNSDPRTNARVYSFRYHIKGDKAEGRPVFNKERSKYSFMAEFIRSDNTEFVPAVFERRKKLKIVQYIGQLGPGGSERQLCNLSIKLREMGFDITVLTGNPLEGASSHYVPLLAEKDIPVRMAKYCDVNMLLQKTQFSPMLKNDFAESVFRNFDLEIPALLNELVTIKPDILHCWLDYCNTLGGVAGIIAGVPRIILGGRNVNPTNLTIMNRPWFKDWYKILLESKRITFINNSKIGARDYAGWLKVDPGTIATVYNGISLNKFEDISEEDIRLFRHSAGISERENLITGIFRLRPEKQPFDFVAVIKEVKKTFVDLKAIIAGVGVLEAELRRVIKKAGLEDSIFLLGQRVDVYTIIKASNVVLLTSETEGVPNVLLEAQYLGIPVVATNAGGIPEAIDDGVTGLLYPVGDIHGMAAGVITILRSRQYAAELGKMGHDFVARNFDINAMVDNFVNIYYEGAVPKQKQHNR